MYECVLYKRLLVDTRTHPEMCPRRDKKCKLDANRQVNIKLIVMLDLFSKTTFYCDNCLPNTFALKNSLHRHFRICKGLAKIVKFKKKVKTFYCKYYMKKCTWRATFLKHLNTECTAAMKRKIRCICGLNLVLHSISIHRSNTMDRILKIQKQENVANQRLLNME